MLWLWLHFFTLWISKEKYKILLQMFEKIHQQEEQTAILNNLDQAIITDTD